MMLMSPAERLMNLWVISSVTCTIVNLAAMLFFDLSIFLPCLVALMLLGLVLVLPICTFLPSYRWFFMLVSYLNRDLVPVELITYRLESHFSMARRLSNGTMDAPVFYMHNIGNCSLLSNGKVDPESESCYVSFWLPLRSDERALQLLANDFPDFDTLRQLNPDDMQQALKGFR